jgi:hypothetical protein
MAIDGADNKPKAANEDRVGQIGLLVPMQKLDISNFTLREVVQAVYRISVGNFSHTEIWCG